MFESLTMSHHLDVVMGARRSLSLIYKKVHRWEEATKLWQDLVAANPHDVFAVEELAKFYEHHAREFGKALEIVRKLLDESVHLSIAERVSLEHRFQRLCRHK
jgi:transcription elongation factor GreA-like protein